MEKLTMPAAYADLTTEEQYQTIGGGEFGTAIKTFFKNIRFGNVVWQDSFVSVSFTFVPTLLFNIFKVGYTVADTLITNISSLMGVGQEAGMQLSTSISSRSSRKSK